MVARAILGAGVVAAAVFAVVAIALSGPAVASTKPPNCAVSRVKNCTAPTKAQIRAHQASRADAVTACTSLNLTIARARLGEALDSVSLGDAVTSLSRTTLHGSIAPPKLLKAITKASNDAALLVAAEALQTWCGDLGVPAG